MRKRAKKGIAGLSRGTTDRKWITKKGSICHEKRIGIVLLTLLLVFTAAAPCFASGGGGTQEPGHIISDGGAGKNLNVYGNAYFVDFQQVVIWDYIAGDVSQEFYQYEADKNSDNYWFRCGPDLSYVLTVDRRSGQNYKCVIYRYEADKEDSKIKIAWANFGGGLYPSHSLCLANYPGHYLKAQGYANNSRVDWTGNGSTSDASQRWSGMEPNM